MIDDRTVKAAVPKGGYPYNILGQLPPCECIFDSYHGTIGFDVMPFAVTTRISASCEIYLKVYVEQ